MKPLAQRLTHRTLISHGDMSAAYRARDTALDRDVFLKLLHPHMAAEPDLRARFEREARAAARLDHPQLVRIYEVGEDPDEGPFMLLEWVEGMTLRAAIAREGTLGVAEVRRLGESMLSALAELHDAGILHRDVKPDNILRRNDGAFKLTDFSLALLADAPKLTHHQAVVGTPAYLAPELARGKAPSQQTDLFALGVALFEAATGSNPFSADSLLESLRRVREVEPDWAALNAVGDANLTMLVRVCLEKEPNDRPASARAALEAFSGQAPMRTLSRRSRRPLALSIAVLVAIVSVAILFWPHSGRQLNTSSLVPAMPQDSNPVSASMDSAGLRPQQDTTAIVEQPVEPVKPRPQVADTVVRKVVAAVDTVEWMLDTTPWAHVSLGGVEIGTTPLSNPLRISAGLHTIVLRNPAYPPIQVALDARANGRQTIKLPEYVEHVALEVEPWGEVYLDNELLGTTPLPTLLRVLPGEHRLRVTHPNFPPVSKQWRATAGDTLRYAVNMANSEFVVAREVP